MENDFDKWFNEHLSKIPPQDNLYHYTSQRGLLGIIRSRCIWATKIQYLSDSSEFNHGLGLAKEAISYLKRDALEKDMPVLSVMEGIIKSIANVNIFVCSFSEEGDLLSQWRSYCSDGGGFSIGFTYEVFKPLLEFQHFSLLPCIYNPQVQLNVVTNFVRKTFEEFRGASSELQEGSPIRKELDVQVTKTLVKLAPFFKHHSFFEEKEWRLISDLTSIYNPQIGFREGKTVLTPYYKFKLAKEDESLSFGDIIVGPSPNNHLSQSALMDLFTSMKIKNHRGLRCSQIPYRGVL